MGNENRRDDVSNTDKGFSARDLERKDRCITEARWTTESKYSKKVMIAGLFMGDNTVVSLLYADIPTKYPRDQVVAWTKYLYVQLTLVVLCSRIEEMDQVWLGSSCTCAFSGA
jgi:hypothetical protein